MAEQGESNKLSAITNSFDQYEYVAVIMPGAAFLFGLMIALPGRLPWTVDKDFSLGLLGIFLVAAYVAGQILRAIGDVVENPFWQRFGGQPTTWVLAPNKAEAKAGDGGQSKKRGLLDPDQTTQLETRLKALTGGSRDFRYYAEPERRGEWQAVTRRIYATVYKAGQSARVDAFNRTGGLMIGLTVALAATGLLLWTEALWRSGLIAPLASETTDVHGLLISGLSHLQELALFGAIALTLAGLTLYRFYVFGILYGRELFVQFLDLPSASPKAHTSRPQGPEPTSNASPPPA